jgi:hypothetical protein
MMSFLSRHFNFLARTLLSSSSRLRSSTLLAYFAGADVKDRDPWPTWLDHSFELIQQAAELNVACLAGVDVKDRDPWPTWLDHYFELIQQAAELNVACLCGS